jgi:hypothetical protein
MVEIIEIIIAVFAVFGVYMLLDMIKFRIMFPPALRERLRAAVYIDSESNDLCKVVAYAKHLRSENKISRGRLIILTDSGIIKEIPQSSIDDFEIILCREPKELSEDAK